MMMISIFVYMLPRYHSMSLFNIEPAAVAAVLMTDEAWVLAVARNQAHAHAHVQRLHQATLIPRRQARPFMTVHLTEVIHE